MSIFISILCALITVTISAVLVGRFYGFFHKSRAILLVIALLFGIVVYAVGYWGDEYSLDFASVVTVGLQSLFSSARFFIFDSDFSLLVNTVATENIWYIMTFALSGIFTMFVTATAVISSFGMSGLMYIKTIFSTIRKTYIILGVDDVSLKLATEIRAREKNSLIIVIDILPKEKQSSILKLAAEHKLTVIKRDIALEANQKKFYLNKLLYNRLFRADSKADVSVIINDCGDTNLVSVALNLIKIHKPAKPVKMHCITSIDSIEDALNSVNSANWDLRVNTYTDIVVDSLASSHPIIDYIDINSDTCNVIEQPSTLVVGEGNMAIKSILSIVKNCQFSGYLPRIIVAGEHGDKIAATLEIIAPELNAAAEIIYNTSAVGSTEFYGMIRKEKFHYVIVATANDDLNIDTALNIKSLLNRTKIGIFAYSTSNKYKKVKEQGVYDGIELIGASEDVYSYDNIIKGKLDKTGIAVNSYYNGGKNNYYDKSIFDRDSSRSFGLNIPTKLRLLGLELTEIGDKSAINAEDYNKLIAHYIDTFARQEHLRWNAFHYCSGFITWKLTDIPADVDVTKDMANKRHACLVSYDELDLISERYKDKVKYIPLGYKGYDIMLIMAIPQILEYCDMAIKLRRTANE